MNENRSVVTPSNVNEVVAGREPAADVGVDDVRDRYAQVLLTLQPVFISGIFSEKLPRKRTFSIIISVT